MSKFPEGTHPVQVYKVEGAYLSQAVTLRAYEVYKHLYGKQEAMVTGGCRGGFSIGEIVAMLYAATFPQPQWQQRFDEALRNSKLKA